MALYALLITGDATVGRKVVRTTAGYSAPGGWTGQKG